MSLDTLTLRPFEPEDAEAIEGARLDTVTLGNTVLIDGIPVAYAGIHKLAVYPCNPPYDFAFFYISDCERGQLLKAKAPLFVHRIIYDAVRALQQDIARIYVLADDKYPKARAWLKALGFVPLTDKPFDIQVLEGHTKAETWVRISEISATSCASPTQP